MPNEPPKDLVIEARELDGWGILAMPPSCVPELQTFEGAKRIDSLLRQFADEVERLRKSNKSMADELGHQDSYWDDPLRGNFKC